MKRARILVASALLSVAGAVRADAPLPAPEKHVACANSGHWCATSDPATATTTIAPRNGGPAAYVLPGWHRWLFVGDDGESVVTGPDGVNLLPMSATLRDPVLVFHRHGTPVRTVLLGELYGDLAQLTRTVSHLAWSDSVRIEGERLVVVLVDARRVEFELRTGHRLVPGERRPGRKGTTIH